MYWQSVCPFMSNPNIECTDETCEPQKVICLEAECRLWDMTSEECVFNVIVPTISNTIQEIVSQIYNVDKHVHDRHLHLKPHEVDSIDHGGGAPLSKTTPLVAALASENAAGEDMDGNGYICGKDFIIDPSGEDTPNAIKNIADADFDGDVISWEEYLNSSSIYSINVT